MPEICPVCGLECEVKNYDGRDTYTYHCARCAPYSITFEAMKALEMFSSTDKAIVSGYLREKTVIGEPRACLTSELIEHIPEQVVPKSVPSKADRLLLNLSRMVKSPEDVIEVNTKTDYSLAYATSPSEVWYYLRWLREKGYLSAGTDSLTGGVYKCRLSIDGWTRVSDLEFTSLETDRVFVAMRFSPEMTEVYMDAIKPALEEAGYHPVCLVETDHIGLVDDKIVKEIRRSRFLVADLTYNRPSVYFEAGFALGLSRPVVWTCRRTDKDDVGFDADHFNILFWDTYTDLKNRLLNRVCASIGFGPRYIN